MMKCPWKAPRLDASSVALSRASPEMKLVITRTTASPRLGRARLVLLFLVAASAALCLRAALSVLREPLPQRDKAHSDLFAHELLGGEKLRPLNATCECRRSDGRAEMMCYRLPADSAVVGRRFDCEHLKHLERLDLLDSRDRGIDYEMLDFPVVAMAASSNHFHELTRLIFHLKKRHNELRLIVFDIGLNPEQQVAVSSVCGVELRAFDFSLYPPHVKRLREFRWKPLIIAEVLRDYESIWYMDTSVVPGKGHINQVYDLIRCRDRFGALPVQSPEARDAREQERPLESEKFDERVFSANVRECRKFPYLLHGWTGHGIFSATAPGVYDFIPTNKTEIKKPKAKMYEAGLAYIVKTDDVTHQVLKWYVLCALKEECMAAHFSKADDCSFGNDRYGEYASCHRFDQSVLNLLLANANHYDRHFFSSEIVDFFHIQREVPLDEQYDLTALTCAQPMLVNLD